MAVGEWGIPDALFWELTPCEFWALAAQRHEAERQEWLKVGFLAASIYNAAPKFGKGTRKAVGVYDVLPGLRPGAKQTQRRAAQSVAEMKFIAQMVHAKYEAAKRVNRRAKDKGDPPVRAPKPPTTRR